MVGNCMGKRLREMRHRRVYMLLSYVLMLAFLVFFEIGKNYSSSLYLSLSPVLGLASLFFMYLAYVRSGFWVLMHKPSRIANDEYRLKAYRVMRLSYSVFAILVVVLFYLFSVFRFSPDVVIALVLLIIAHTMPITFFSWSMQR